MSEYIDNILGQPSALQALLANLDLAPLQDLAGRVRSGHFDRIILTGMGASLFAAYPAWHILSAAGLPAWWLEAGELAESASALITPHSLLWIVSQAGHVPEGLSLLAALSGRPPALVLATTNQLDSPLAAHAGLVQPLHTAVEQGVATRSFVNTLAITQLAALAIAGLELAPALDQLQAVIESLAAYLAGWEPAVEQIAALLPNADRLLLVGQGASLAAALDGALVLKEAARVNAEALSSGQFRHGPLELADPRLTVLVFESAQHLAVSDQSLAQTIAACGARALSIGAGGAPSPHALPAPAAAGIAVPIAQILPIQLLSLHLARQQGFEAAAFRHLGKVTWPSQIGGQLP